MASLGDLVVTVGAQISGFKDAMGEVDKTLAGLGHKAEEFLNHFEGMGSRLVEGLAIGALTMAVFEAGEQIENAMIEISRSTGATGEELENLGHTFRSVFEDAVQSSKDLAGGLGLLSQRTGATEEDLKALLTIYSKLAQVTGQQLLPLIDQTQKVFAAWGVTIAEQPAKLDALLTISQKTGVSISSLGGMMQGTGATLRTMGLSFNDAAALMANFETHGINTSRVMMTLNQSLVNLEKEGVGDARAKLGELIQSVINAKDPMEALSIAAENFKGKGIVPLVDALRLGVTNIDKLKDAANGSVGAVQKAVDTSEEFGERLTKLKNKTVILLEPLGVELVAALTKIIESAATGVKVLSELGNSFGGLDPSVKIVVGGLAAMSAALLIFSTESVLGAIAAVGTFSTAMTTGFVASLMAGTAALSELSLAGMIAGLEAAGASVLAFSGRIVAMGMTITAALSEISFAGVIAGFSSMTFSVQAVAAAVGGLTASFLPALVSVMSVLAVATLAVGSAFAGWKLGEWLRENIPLAQKFGDTLGDWILKIPGVNALIMQFSGANEGVSKATSDLTATTQALSAKLAEHGVIVKRGMMSLEEYAAALQKAAKSAKPLGDAAAGASVHVSNLAKSFEALGVKVAPTPEAINKITDALEFVKSAYEHGTVSLQVYNAAVDAFGKKMKESFGDHDWAGPIDKLGEALKNAGIKSYIDELEKLRTAQALAAEAFAAGRIGPEEYAEAINKTNEAVKKAHPITQQLWDDLKTTGQMFEDIDAQILKSTDAQGQALGGLNQTFELVIRNIPTADGALRTLGLKTVPQLQLALKDATTNFIAISAAFKVNQATSEQVAIAWDKMHEAELRLSEDRLDARALGLPDLERLHGTILSDIDAYNRLVSGLHNVRQAKEAEIGILREEIYLGQQLGENTDALQIRLGHLTEAIRRQNEGWATTILQIRQVIGSGLTQALDDLIFHTDKVADDFKKLGESVVDTFVNHILKLAIQPALDALDKLELKLISVVSKSLGISGGGGGGGLNIPLPNIGGATPPFAGGGIPGLPNGGMGTPSDFPQLPGFGGEAPAVTGAAGSAASSGLGAVMGIVGAVGSVVSAISGIISNFQLARQEGTLNAIEQHTKVMSIVIAGISAPWEKMADGQDTLFGRLINMGNTINERLPWIATFTHDTAAILKDNIAIGISYAVESLKSIDSKMGGTTKVGSANSAPANITINVNGAGDPTAVAKSVMDLLKSQSPVFV